MNKNLIILGGTSVYINEKRDITLKNTFYNYLKKFESNFNKIYWIVPNTSLFELNSIADFKKIKVLTFNKTISGIFLINLRLFLKLLSLKNKYILHFNSPFTFPNYYFLKKNSYKFLSYVGIDYNDILNFDRLSNFPLWKNYYFFYLKTLLKNSDIILARGKTIFDYCKKYNQNVTLTDYIGWDFKKEISLKEFIKTNHINKNLNILFIGKIIKEKGIFDLLKVFIQLTKEYKDFTFNLKIVGDGQDKENLIKIIKLFNNIKYYGWIDNENELLDILNDSNLLICPTRPGYPEGVPRVIDEALNLYKLVIASKVGGIAKEFEQNPPLILFECGDINSLKKSIEEIIYNNIDLRQIYKNINSRIKGGSGAADQHIDLLNS